MENVLLRIRTYIHHCYISQKQLSIDAGMTAAKLSQLLSGKRQLRLADYLTLCDALGVPHEYFLSGDLNDFTERWRA